MLEKKYKLTDETLTFGDITLHRIEAIRDFGHVKAGDKGGWIERESNLSHNSNCWVWGNARVYDNARVYNNARVGGFLRVYGNAKVYEPARA